MKVGLSARNRANSPFADFCTPLFNSHESGEDIDHSGAPELQVNSDGKLLEAKGWRCCGMGRRNSAGVQFR